MKLSPSSAAIPVAALPFLLLALSAPAQAPASAPVLDGPISHSGPRNIPNLVLLGAPVENARKKEATYEGKGYWAARREWEQLERAELPAAPILRSVAAEVYRERRRRLAEATGASRTWGGPGDSDISPPSAATRHVDHR